MINQYNFFFVLFFLSFLSACVAQNPKPNVKQAAAPSWYTTPPIASSHYWMGVGSEATANLAEKKALISIAERLNITVKSHFEHKIRSLRQNNKEQIQVWTNLDLTTYTEDVTFRAYVVERSEHIGGQYYVQVKVDTHKFFQERLNHLKSLDQNLDNMMSLMTSYSLVTQLQKMREVTQTVDKAEELTIMLNAFDQIPNAESQLARYTALRHEERKIRSNIRFYIVSDPYTAIMANYLKEKINKEFRTVKRLQPKVTRIRIQGEKIDKKFNNIFMTKIIMRIRLDDSGEEISSKEGVVFSGSSPSDFSTALRAASNQFEEYVKTHSVLNILGLED